ncbi:unnamed protein product [Pleuronectes platessa]|uniref:Uncharacterized protein n=1 Tax=Pleuronectes platessa TaxID=8262 RepID=A0A9N7YAT4_PLEPL|nr:unnamed protein product [Pleuronectes platessa]
MLLIDWLEAVDYHGPLVTRYLMMRGGRDEGRRRGEEGGMRGRRAGTRCQPARLPLLPSNRRVLMRLWGGRAQFLGVCCERLLRPHWRAASQGPGTGLTAVGARLHSEKPYHMNAAVETGFQGSSTFGLQHEVLRVEIKGSPVMTSVWAVWGGVRLSRCSPVTAPLSHVLIQRAVHGTACSSGVLGQQPRK